MYYLYTLGYDSDISVALFASSFALARALHFGNRDSYCMITDILCWRVPYIPNLFAPENKHLGEENYGFLQMYHYIPCSPAQDRKYFTKFHNLLFSLTNVKILNLNYPYSIARCICQCIIQCIILYIGIIHRCRYR